MRTKPSKFSNFSRTLHTAADSIRPEDETQIQTIFLKKSNNYLLARGSGLSYSDCCVNNNEVIVDTCRLNHILSFDSTTGIAVCQSAVVFADLLALDSRFIPPILPGTLYATLAGGVANDVHGKNNPHLGNFGHHIEWLELQVGNQTLICSPKENEALFKATIAGLGLTGIITRIALRMRNASHWVERTIETFSCFPTLLEYMQNEGLSYDYQVAWLDLLNKPRALLSLANHVRSNKLSNLSSPQRKRIVPKIPVRIVNRYLMQQFNRFYYLKAHTNKTKLPLWQFNNPLDGIQHWNRLYGKKGLVQFQAVFPEANAALVLDNLLSIIKIHNATPTLAVLKYFTKPGIGLLSFTAQGFSIAIDFIHNQHAQQAIRAMNQLITTLGGKIYLAKDLLLTREQFSTMYPNHADFSDLLGQYETLMRSDLSQRLGIGVPQ
jgi:decaprenylphospho-beta-D-ribofuranose 2-oxidase